MDIQEETVLAVVRKFILLVMDEDDIEVELHTSFQDDLELESIEMIALGDELQSYYGDRLDFAHWLSQLSLHDLMALTVADLVAWIKQSLNQ